MLILLIFHYVTCNLDLKLRKLPGIQTLAEIKNDEAYHAILK
jgi:hypothetical protein